MGRSNQNTTDTKKVRRAALRAILLIATSGLIAAPGYSAPEITVENKNYGVDGATAKELDRQMRKRGPKGFWAYTRWEIKWSKDCKVHVHLTYTMPEHMDPDGMSPKLRADWTRMIKALRLHEQQHGAHGIAAAREIEQAGCKKTGRIVRKYHRADRQFDRRTKHGSKTGVTLD